MTLKSLNDTTYGGNWRIYNSNSDDNYSDLYFSSINGALVTMNDVFSARRVVLLDNTGVHIQILNIQKIC